RNLMVMASLKVPIVSVVIGEGGSGGALAIGVADRLLMLQYAVYSVISPEGCAAILWNDPKKTPDAAEALKMTAEDLLRLGVIDEILPEPPRIAQRSRAFRRRGPADRLYAPRCIWAPIRCHPLPFSNNRPPARLGRMFKKVVRRGRKELGD